MEISKFEKKQVKKTNLCQDLENRVIVCAQGILSQVSIDLSQYCIDTLSSAQLTLLIDISDDSGQTLIDAY